MIIAIDGHSSCGKSTIAKALAKKLGVAYIDTGAMYRSIALYFLKNHIEVSNHQAAISALEDIEITIVNENGINQIYLNNENVSSQIRTLEVSNLVSPVATIPEVRSKLVALQRAMGKTSLVMDGRDIGSVVFPNADVKFFITADLRTRAQRRFDEISVFQPDITLAEVEENLARRDQIDSSRTTSPLVQLPDAIVIDTTHLGLNEQLELVYQYVMQKVKI
ncbi:MAG TPA: (d)CMP kinase [Saprospiraceae bacterium]|nr:(d)CMP kinase [Saprospiraceae bacterium]